MVTRMKFKQPDETYDEYHIRILADWQISKARAACDYNDDSKRKSFLKEAADKLNKQVNELSGDELTAACDSTVEILELPIPLANKLLGLWKKEKDAEKKAMKKHKK